MDFAAKKSFFNIAVDVNIINLIYTNGILNAKHLNHDNLFITFSITKSRKNEF